jgi:hypothetical protein
VLDVGTFWINYRTESSVLRAFGTFIPQIPILILLYNVNVLFVDIVQFTQNSAII